VGLVLAVVLAPFLLAVFFRHELYAHSPALYWAFDLLKFVVLPTAAVVYLGRGHGIWPRHYGIRSIAEHESWAHFVGLAAFLALLLNLVYYVAFYIAWYALHPEPSPLFYKEINPAGLLRIPVTIYFAVTAGFVEEVFCRALPLLYLERRFPGQVPVKIYVLGTAIVFGLIHWGNGPHEVVATFVFGVVAAILYLRLRDLWPLIAAHTIIDLVAFA
jgi:membrane protease YdiL (CAAX protease family)